MDFVGSHENATEHFSLTLPEHGQRIYSTAHGSLRENGVDGPLTLSVAWDDRESATSSREQETVHYGSGMPGVSFFKK